MQPHKHLMISAVVGVAAWWGTGKLASGAAALIAGVLPDVDHLVDYSYYYWRREHRIILPLHGYEYAVLGATTALLAQNNVVASAALSYLIHLLADHAENRTRILGYSLLFRAWNRFRMEKVSTNPEAAARGRMEDIDSIIRLLRRWRMNLGLS